MKLIIDKEYNVAYMYLAEKEDFKVVKTIETDGINVDIGKDGTILGIEFLNANEQLKNIIGKRKMTFEFKNISNKKSKRASLHTA